MQVVETVYFIQDLENLRVKIGKAVDYKSRLSILQIGSSSDLEVILLLAGYSKLETSLHKKFKKYRVRGEWFEFSEELQKFVENNLKNDVRKGGRDIIPPYVAPSKVEIQVFKKPEKQVKYVPVRVFTGEDNTMLHTFYTECFGDFELIATKSGLTLDEVAYRMVQQRKYDSELSAIHAAIYPNFHKLTVDQKLDLFKKHLEPEITLEELAQKWGFSL